ncbi:neurotrypsin-like [Branchiostoma floridae]|uniref:Soluble scavenger receptor cysteine-rich domain-containing protein SSC5D n=1 Tax=Branchiostoma floridae TaxID=7739 RepID=A0A9J7HT04_BRAFL|nr:neurotrypsin-like [Branchiostoma floridae]
MQVTTIGGGSLRLVGGVAPWGGRLEFRPWQAAELGTVCNTSWTEAETELVCRQLGYTGGVSASLPAFGEGTGPIWLGDVTCEEDDVSITSCRFSWEPSDCDHSQDVAVVCTGGVSVRLTGSQSPLQGRVEVRPGNGDWGTVCDDGFDDRDAQVVCRQLGYRGGVTTAGGDFGDGAGLIRLGILDCSGDESSVADCEINRWGDHDCSHKKTAGVICTDDVSVRLNGSQSPLQGRVEIRPKHGDWGTICDDGFDDKDAQVVCRQIGYRGGVATAGGDFGEGTGNIWLQNVNCIGAESSLGDCPIQSWGSQDCSHRQDAGVVCTGEVSVRLIGGQNSSEGRVEVRPGNGDWGTVCDDGLDNRYAQVVCRQLGYRGGVSRVGGVFPEGTGNIWLDNLSCAGNESSVADCEISRWGDHDCTHKEDAGVVCGNAAEEDCAGYYSSGRTSGVYPIGLLPADVEAYCDMNTAGGGWTVIQRRQDGVSGESDGYRLHISGYSGTAGDSMAHNNGQRFSTVDRDNDALSSVHCSQRHGQGGWWFGHCSNSFLNGRYLGNCGSSCPSWQGVEWYHWRGPYYSLKSVSMKIRP